MDFVRMSIFIDSKHRKNFGRKNSQEYNTLTFLYRR